MSGHPAPDERRGLILVVDDAPATLGLLDDMLDQAGYRVLMAQNAEAGLRILARALEAAERKGPRLPNPDLRNPGLPDPGLADRGPTDRSATDAGLPDLILIDVVMPGLGGLEACRRIKADGRLAAIPVVVMTGLSEPEQVVRAFEAGASDFVSKPLQLPEVLARLRVHLLASRRTRAAHRALDVAGRYLLAVDAGGQLLWATPQAAALLAAPGESDSRQSDSRQPEGWQPEGWRLEPAEAARLAAGEVASGAALAGPGALRLAFVGRLGEGELLLRVLPEQVAPEQRLRERLDLTLREAEVLLWIGRGKPSRDVADILGLSPRTVDKHLEQVYNKLGIGNRAAAASLAARVLGEAGG